MSSAVPSSVDNTLHVTASRQPLRRVSSHNAKRADLFSGPTVVGPPEQLGSSTGASEMAMAMEMAKHHLAEASQPPTPDDSKPATPHEGRLATTDKYAFAFDIDGVLIKGGKVIPEAIEAMRVLNGENEFGIKV
jgi:hypothetical protein